MSVVAAKYLWRVLAVSSVIVFAYATVLAKLGRDWWTDENYSHGLLIPFVIGYILWTQRDRMSREPAKPAFFWGLSIIVLGLVGLWAGIAGAELFIQRISLVMVLAGTVVYFWGIKFLRFTLVPFALLLLAIPIPAIIFNKIAFPLQLFASRCAVWSMIRQRTPWRASSLAIVRPTGPAPTISTSVAFCMMRRPPDCSAFAWKCGAERRAAAHIRARPPAVTMIGDPSGDDERTVAAVAAVALDREVRIACL